MNLQKKNLKLTFCITLLLTLVFPIIFPALRITYFIPFIIIAYYQRPYIDSLWISLICGAILDLLSSSSRLGIYAVNFTLITTILYHQRKHFFADSLFTLPVMTFIFSVISTMIQVILFSLFEKGIHISKEWIVSDLLVYPLLDGAFGFVFFVFPFLLFGKPIRKGKDYFSKESEG